MPQLIAGWRKDRPALKIQLTQMISALPYAAKSVLTRTQLMGI